MIPTASRSALGVRHESPSQKKKGRSPLYVLSKKLVRVLVLMLWLSLYAPAAQEVHSCKSQHAGQQQS